VLSTATKNLPSKRASRDSLAREQICQLRSTVDAPRGHVERKIPRTASSTLPIPSTSNCCCPARSLADRRRCSDLPCTFADLDFGRALQSLSAMPAHKSTSANVRRRSLRDPILLEQ